MVIVRIMYELLSEKNYKIIWILFICNNNFQSNIKYSKILCINDTYLKCQILSFGLGTISEYNYYILKTAVENKKLFKYFK